MNRLTLQSLELNNFKGIKKYYVDLGGNNLAIFGKNATGKTSLVDAVNWLLFGKDSHGKADFTIKPHDKNGKVDSHLETEVTGKFEYNHKPITLKKRYKEKWTKKRGDANNSFTGHQTDCFINDVPTKIGEFNKKVAEMIDINIFKLTTNPLHFATMHWAEQRRILFDMFGEVTDQEIIDSKAKLAPLTAILGECTIDDHKKKIKAQKTSINKEKNEIPARVAENLEASKDLIKPDQGLKDEYDKALVDEKEKYRAMVSNEAVSLKKIRLNEIAGEIQKIKNGAQEEISKSKKPILDFIDQLETNQRAATKQIKILTEDISSDETRNRLATIAIDKVREKWHVEDDKKQPDDKMCPTCRQALPDNMRKEAKLSFNRSKAERLKKITAEGKTLAAGIAQRENDIMGARERITALESDLSITMEAIDRKKEELKKISDPAPVETPELLLEKGGLEKEIEAMINGSLVREGNSKLKIREIEDQIGQWNVEQAKYDAGKKCRDRIEELSTQEETLSKELERLEAELFLIESFIEQKVKLLTDGINAKFKLAKFKLFKEQINEGLSEWCEVIYEGVPYNSGLNSSARINVGLDIISTLSEFYEFTAPVFLDNAESINEILPMDAQVISLSVSLDEKLMVLETEAQQAS